MSKKMYFIRVGAGKFVVEYDGKRTPIENDRFINAYEKAHCLASMLKAEMVCADEWTEETKP